MKLFLDTSVLLAAAGSATGASRALFGGKWRLITSHYCIAESLRNLGKLPDPIAAQLVWEQSLFPSLQLVPDVLTISKPLVFAAAKDKPVLLSAFAEDSNYLLTLDRADFATFLGNSFYSLKVRTPAAFLAEQRAP